MADQYSNEDYENQYYLSLSTRINFGAESEDPVRYPDDLFDRIWESDSVKKANYLVDVAEGTERVSNDMPIDVNTHERPPEKVMQTAVVGMNGSLTYRLNLDGFPGYGWAATYYAEIEDLRPSESRKFRLILPGHSDMSIPIVNIQKNALGKYRLYQPGYPNVSLPFVLSFRFGKTSDLSCTDSSPGSSWPCRTRGLVGDSVGHGTRMGHRWDSTVTW
ncbi:probable LRR receptor-like serine/threonine-protein kinase At1g67720 isoform X2 [Euphorbia lathyris]|uniref:probable LRR receptor-like serine/threonine-protein kinase At1g67720 isoform X2 n=1 Tax=Euphorbia lathyris TaxID=212925 RepID=UPI003313E7D7